MHVSVGFPSPKQQLKVLAEMFAVIQCPNLRAVDFSRTLGSSSSCNTRIDWNKLMLSESVELAGSVGASLFVTPFKFLQWQGWLCEQI